MSLFWIVPKSNLTVCLIPLKQLGLIPCALVWFPLWTFFLSKPVLYPQDLLMSTFLTIPRTFQTLPTLLWPVLLHKGQPRKLTKPADQWPAPTTNKSHNNRSRRNGGQSVGKSRQQGQENGVADVKTRPTSVEIFLSKICRMAHIQLKFIRYFSNCVP